MSQKKISVKNLQIAYQKNGLISERIELKFYMQIQKTFG